MAWFLSRKPKISDAQYALYGAIVAQSRQPQFYADWGVPDTLTGRFDMVSLHMALVLRRLQKEGPRCAVFSQTLFDLFFKDMDRSLREMGVGDISVPKRIEKMGGLFYGLVEALDTAIETSEPGAIEAVLLKDILPEEAAAHAAPLARYLEANVAELDATDAESIMAGQLAWSRAA